MSNLYFTILPKFRDIFNDSDVVSLQKKSSVKYITTFKIFSIMFWVNLCNLLKIFYQNSMINNSKNITINIKIRLRFKKIKNKI